MTDLVFWTALSGLLLSLAWVLYIVDRMMTWGVMGAIVGDDGARPAQSPWAQRHKRAHTVAVELFVAWGPLAALAAVTRPDDALPGALAMWFFFGLLVHNVSYLFGIPGVRTISFVVAALSSAALALRLLGVI